MKRTIALPPALFKNAHLLKCILILLFPLICRPQHSDPNLYKAKNLPASPVYYPLKIGSVAPKGWLLDWAELAANGITGHLDRRIIYREGG